MTHYYRIYGLNIASDILCPELIELDTTKHNKIDVEIRFGVMDEEIKAQLKLGRFSSFESRDMWFHVPNVATYWIQKGHLVLIQTEPNVTVELIKQFVLGSCLGLIMLQRDKIAIHGGTVVLGNKGLLITGDRGAGKSTLTSALREKGYALVADDVSAVDVEKSLIYPAYPQQKVCEDMMEQLGYDKSQYKKLEVDSKIKYLIPTRHQFMDCPVSMEGIVELSCHSQTDALEIEELKGSEKLMTIYRNIYRIEMKIASGVNPDFFKQCVELSKKIPVYRIKRPKDVWSVEQQINWIESKFSNRT